MSVAPLFVQSTHLYDHSVVFCIAQMPQTIFGAHPALTTVRCSHSSIIEWTHSLTAS